MCGPAPSATVVSRSMNYKRAPRDQSALAGNVGTGGAFQRYRAGGIRMSTFLCSPRTDPAPLRFWAGSAGPVRARRERWDRKGFPALSRWGDQDVDVPMLAADRSRSAAVLVGLRGIRPARAGKLEGGGAFALRAGDWFDRFQCLLRPDPAPLRFLEALRDRALPGGGPEKDQRSSRRMAS
jgi:hypothetical protein